MASLGSRNDKLNCFVGHDLTDVAKAQSAVTRRVLTNNTQLIGHGSPSVDLGKLSGAQGHRFFDVRELIFDDAFWIMHGVNNGFKKVN